MTASAVLTLCMGKAPKAFCGTVMPVLPKVMVLIEGCRISEQAYGLAVIVIDLFLVDYHVAVTAKLGSLGLDSLEIDLSSVDLKHDLACF